MVIITILLSLFWKSIISRQCCHKYGFVQSLLLSAETLKDGCLLTDWILEDCEKLKNSAVSLRLVATLRYLRGLCMYSYHLGYSCA